MPYQPFYKNPCPGVGTQCNRSIEIILSISMNRWLHLLYSRFKIQKCLLFISDTREYTFYIRNVIIVLICRDPDQSRRDLSNIKNKGKSKKDILVYTLVLTHRYFRVQRGQECNYAITYLYNFDFRVFMAFTI